ncbi:triose-phosphate isomerase family protein [Salinibacterium sp. SWN248]|uniref:triose-phosphate isomerase family protein n=1 Tax=Salinibacterium sp. SWN248 TaxID=2792056 RepID=UPI0018CD0472|nr:triose-phosphate isomerase family protein [Salinibacterium sp. SWN248]MBH0024385.1 triosephosphate isomerase [Salinibacterium sp. SWN248]
MSSLGSVRPVQVGVSLKMYFSHDRTVAWCTAVAEIARTHDAVLSGAAELFVIPTFPSIPAAHQILNGVARVGAQNLSTEDAGALTGEVSGSVLAEVGCTVVEVGHAERRRLFGETDPIVRAKTAAALRNNLRPVLCVGEAHQSTAAEAAAECIRQLDDALMDADADGHRGAITVAYEPHWAIGAPEPASARHIQDVCTLLREYAARLELHSGSAVIYGGSAGPGLLTELAGTVDGLFLGRFAHDPAAIRSILDEIGRIASDRTSDRPAVAGH